MKIQVWKNFSALIYHLIKPLEKFNFTSLCGSHFRFHRNFGKINQHSIGKPGLVSNGHGLSILGCLSLV